MTKSRQVFSLAETAATVGTGLQLIVFVPLGRAFCFNRKCVHKVPLQLLLDHFVHQPMSL